MAPSLGVWAVYSDALRIYALLFRRSVVTAAIVFAVVTVLAVVNEVTPGRGAAIALGILVFVLSIAASPFVQGALVEIVRNIHEGRAAKPIGALYGKARERLWALVGASIIYGLGVFALLLLLIVPGLVAASRWALMAPFVVLENEGAFLALDSSRRTVRGYTGRVLLIVILTFLITDALAILVQLRFLESLFARHAFFFAWYSLTAPFSAHVLTVLYYRLTDPARPVIHPDVRRWRSVWEGA